MVKKQITKKPNTGELITSNPGSETFAPHRVDNRTLSIDDLQSILSDGYISSLWEKRRGGAIGANWAVEDGRDNHGKITADSKLASNLVSKILEKIGFDRLTLKMMSAIWYGYSVAQIIWDTVDGQIIPVDVKVHDIKKFKFDSQKNIWVYKNNLPLPDKKFWIFTAMGENDDMPYGRGLGFDVHLAWYLRKFGWKFWAKYLEKFGGPTVKGSFPPSAEKDDVERFEVALGDIHQMGWLAIPDGYTAEIMGGGTAGGKSNHDLFMEKWDKTLPIIILGQNLTTQDGASLSQAIVHKDVQDSLILRDSSLLLESFNSSIIKWLVELNYPRAALPRVYRNFSPPENLNTRAKRDEIITKMSGLRPTKKYITDTYGGEWSDTFVGSKFNQSPSFSQDSATSTNNDEDAITAITDDLDGGFIETNPFAQFAENLINKYNNLDDLNNDWPNIEQSLMANSALLEFAKKLKNGISSSLLNGALSTDQSMKVVDNDNG